MFYELFCLISLKIEEKNISSVVEKIEKIIIDLKGAIIHKEDLAEKKLVYSIKKEKTGQGLLIHFEIERGSLKLLGERLKTTPEIIRFQIIKAKIKAKRSKPEEKKEKLEEKTERKKISKLEKSQIFDKLDI